MLRSIPLMTRMTNMQKMATTSSRHAGNEGTHMGQKTSGYEPWSPHVFEKHDRLSRKMLSFFEDVRTRVQRNIVDLEQEIETWRPEFGEHALLFMHEEKARWGEILSDLH